MHQHPLLPLLLRTGSAFGFATMAMLIKLASDRGASVPEIMIWRQAVPVVLILGWLAMTGGLPLLRTRRFGSHARRSLTGMAGMLCNFTAVAHLQLAEAVTLSFTAPMFAVMLAALWLREHVGPWRWSAVLIGFAGVLVIAQPGHSPIPPLGAAAGLGAALVVALVSYQIRDLGRTEPSIATTFYFSAIGTPIAALLLPFSDTALSLDQWPIMLAIGVSGTIGQLLMVASLRHGAVSSVIVMDYTALIWAMAYGWLVWDKLPSAATWLGAPLIVIAGLLIAWREHHLSKVPSPISAIDADRTG